MSREFTDALQDEMAPMMTKEEIQMMISGLVDQIEARMWRVVAFATGILIGVIAIATTLILTLNRLQRREHAAQTDQRADQQMQLRRPFQHRVER